MPDQEQVLPAVEAVVPPIPDLVAFRLGWEPVNWDLDLPPRQLEFEAAAGSRHLVVAHRAVGPRLICRVVAFAPEPVLRVWALVDPPR